jgi:hypothetical protein
MNSPLPQIASAVASGLASASWSIAGTTVLRRNWAGLDVSEMTAPTIIVTPGGVEPSRIGRTQFQYDYTIHIFVGRRVATDSDIDAMMDLAETVLRMIRSHSYPAVSFPAGITSPVSVAAEFNPDDALNERNAWRAVITATYRSLP